MNPTHQHHQAAQEEVRAVYEAFVRTIRTREESLDEPVLAGIEVDPVTAQLRLPVTLWESGRKQSRAAAALVAYRPFLDPESRATIEPLLVGLDVLVTTLDEFIDASRCDFSRRMELAVCAAFASFLAFDSVPGAGRDDVRSAVVTYLLTAARIPPVERAVGRRLQRSESSDRTDELVEFAYAFRAQDISVFGVLPGLVCDVDAATIGRIVRDLETYRAHSLLFDDVRDLDEDQRNGLTTPVGWLVRTADDADIAVERLFDVYRSFEYGPNDYCETLREMEPEPESLADDIAVAVRQFGGPVSTT
jgi:hypothetical protein